MHRLTLFDLMYDMQLFCIKSSHSYGLLHPIFNFKVFSVYVLPSSFLSAQFLYVHVMYLLDGTTISIV